MNETLQAIDRNRYKLVEWSYPTSDNAKQFGFYKTGCYTLHVASVATAHKTFSGHATLAEAKKAGQVFAELPWHPAMNEGWRSH